MSKISLVSIGLKSTEKSFTLRFNPSFFILLIVKSLEILSKHSVQFFISESFASAVNVVSSNPCVDHPPDTFIFIINMHR